MENVELFLKELEEYINNKKLVQELTSDNGVDTASCARDEYKHLQADALAFTGQISPTIKSVCSVYKSVSVNSDGYLCIYNNPPHIDSYNHENCFSVFSGAQATVKNSLVSLITMIKQNQNAPTKSQQLLYSICLGYNTITSIGAKADELSKQASMKESQKRDEEYYAIDKKIQAFENKYGSVDSRINEIIESNKQTQKRIFVNNEIEIEKSYTSEIKLPLCYNTLEANKELFNGERIVSTVKYWSPKEEGILYIKPQGLSGEEISSYIQSIMVSFLHSYPVKAKKLAFCDTSKNEHLISFSGVITGKKLSKLIYGGKREVAIFEEENDIKSLFSTLSHNRATRLTLFSRSNVNDIFEYNIKNEDNIQPLMLVLINDYSEAKYRKSIKEIYSIAAELKKVGIYLLVVEGKAQPASERSYSDEIPLDLLDKASKICILKKAGGKICLEENGKTSYATGFDGSFDLGYVIGKYERAYEDEKSAIALCSILEEKKDTDTIYRLSIPIGKQGSSIVSISLSMDDSNAHAVISGMTGSGKSSLLQDIVLSGAYKYSPKEVEFWVLDFKDGKGFEKFEALKHVRMMSLKNKKSETEEIMGYLMEEKTKRDNLFKEIAQRHNIEVGDLKKYNKNAGKYGYEPLPRVIVVIDEYTQMSIKCVPMLSRIAQQGRSYGISLVMCSLLVDSSFNEVVSQINNRFEFESPKYGALINTRGKDDDRSFGPKTGSLGEESCGGMFLGELTGNCIFASGNEALKQMRAAYESDIVSRIEKINAKYSEIPTKSPIIIGRPERIYMDTKNEDFCKDIETSEIPLGQTRKGDIVSYTVGRNNPLVLIMGSGERSSSIEYSIARRFAKMSKGDKNIYYFDLSNGNYEENNIMEKSAKEMDSLRFSNNLAKAKSLLLELNDIYKARQQSYNAKTDSQIAIILHYADELDTYVKAYEAQAMSAQSDRDFSEGPARASRRALQASMGDFNIVSILTNLVCYGRNLGIYVTLHFGDCNKIDSITNKVCQLTNSTHSLKITQTSIIVPNIPQKSVSEFKRNNSIAEEANKVNSYIKLIDRTAETGYEKEKQKDLEEEDFVYAVLAQNLISKFIPYEWREKDDI